MTDVRVTTTEAAITGESVVRSITVLTFSGTVTSEGGAVTSVNGQTGAVVLDAADVGADPAGSAATAQTTAEAYADSKVAAEVTRADAAYDASGSAATAQSTAEAYTDAQVSALDAAAVGALASVVAGDNITVDNTDPQNPVITSTASGTGSVSSDDITDATVVGKSVLTAADEAAARMAIGAGTSDLELGTTSTTALAGDTAIPDSPDDIGAATAAQGALADTAVQPADLATVATTGVYSDLTGTPTIPDSADDIGAVPTTRTVAGHALSADVTLSASDVSAVPTTRTVNSKALSADITLGVADISGAISGLTSDDASVTITDNGDGTLDLAASGGGGGSGTVKDPRWNVLTGQTSIDEFNDASLDAAWVRVDGAAAPVGEATWTENGDVVSGVQNGSGSGMHGLMIPLSGFGGALGTGDAIVTCHTTYGSSTNAQYLIGGLILSTNATYGAGAQLTNEDVFAGGSNGATWYSIDYTNWTTGGTATSLSTAFGQVGLPFYRRLVNLGSNVWRADRSLDGINWVKGSTTKTWSNTPTHAGLMIRSSGTTTIGIHSFEFLRRVSGVS